MTPSASARHARLAVAWLLSLLASVATASAAPAPGDSTGARIYAEICSACHGPDPRSLDQFKGSEEDLRLILSGQTDRMPDFYGVFSDEEVAAIFAYIRARPE